jgi:hypothetical protein
MSNETWLISRKVDASMKIFCGKENLLYDFELLIGGSVQEDKGLITYHRQFRKQFWKRDLMWIYIKSWINCRDFYLFLIDSG